MTQYGLATSAFLGLSFLLVSPLTETVCADQDKARAALHTAIDDLVSCADTVTDETFALWRQHLDVDELQVQLDRGVEADAATVAAMLGQFARFTDGMKHPPVACVRIALEDWLVELPTPDADHLTAECLLATDAFVPRTDADVRVTRTKLAQAVALLDARLNDDSEGGDSWRKYLRWDDLHAELAADSPDMETLDAIWSLYTSGQEGLGLIWFKDVRRALDAHIMMIREADKSPEEQEALRASYEGLLGGLPEVLDRHRQTPTAEDATAIAGILAWLDRIGQAPRLVRVIRLHLNRPNVFVQASEEFVQAAINRPVDDTMPLRDMILGTRIYGTGHTQGSLTADLVPSEDRAELCFTLQATTESNTTGYNGPVRIYGSATAISTTTKTLLIDNRHVWSLPAEASVELDTNINRIRSRSGWRLIEQMARRRASQQKPQADYIAREHAERKAEKRFDEQSVELVEKMNDMLIDRVRTPLELRGLLPEQSSVRSTDTAMHGQSLQAGPRDLAAPNDPPAVEGEPDLVLRIHESAIANLTADAFGGMVCDENRLSGLVAELLGKPSDDSTADEGEEQEDPIEVTFPATGAPISVVFEENRIRATLRGKKFVQDGKTRPGMNVTVVYRIEPTDDGFKAVLEGETEILPPDGGTLTVPQTAMASIIRRRLAEVLEAEFVPQPIAFNDNWAGIGQLVLVEWEASGGWLTMAWDRVAPK